MTPDLSFSTTGREGESSARILDGICEKKLIQYENSFSDKQHKQEITAVHSGGILIQCHPATSRRRRSLLSFFAANIWLLVCRDMAIWPLLCPEWLYP